MTRLGDAPSEPLRVEAQNLVKHFASGAGLVRALDDVSIDIRPGEMVVLLGPSGCGKTTLLRSIAGLEQPERGQIVIAGRLVYSAARKIRVPPEGRGISMVFQSYALWPHMSVFENIAYPLRCRRAGEPQLAARVRQVMDTVGLGGLSERLPAQLSGGQQQRVALARAIAADASVILFDEPLSNVDAKVRDMIRREIVGLQRELGFAGLYVTHDQVEAGALADTLVVMDRGRVAQIGPPHEVYDAPETRYVATFMGSANELAGSVEAVRDGHVAVAADLGPMLGSPRGAALRPGEPVSVLFRPEACGLSEAAPEGLNVWPCTVKRSMFMGAFAELLVDVAGARGPVQITALAPKNRFGEGARLWLRLRPEAVWVFPA